MIVIGYCVSLCLINIFHFLFDQILSGGFSGSKDPNGPLLNKKRKLLESEGVQFDDSSRSIVELRVAGESLHVFEDGVSI